MNNNIVGYKNSKKIVHNLQSFKDFDLFLDLIKHLLEFSFVNI